MIYRPVIVIPCHNHSDAFEKFAPRVAVANLPVIVVDDGSKPVMGRKLRRICTQYDFKYIHNWPNGGKGRAMAIGFDTALSAGYTHALQIDADGQHDVNDIEKFINMSRAAPDAIIVGNPLYGADAPRGRVVGRRITNFWVMVETWCRTMPDAMCGFRVYPLNETVRQMRRLRFFRMGFDIEILVRLYWARVPVVGCNTRVIYPADGISNFKMIVDNFHISLMHIYLCIMMPIKMILRWCKKCKNKLK